MSLKLSGVSKRFTDERFLRDVSLEVAPGEIFGLLGANESGKTTVLQIIAGLEKADSGVISFDDDRDLKESGFYLAGNSQDASAWKNFVFKDILKMKEFSEYFKQKVEFEKALFEARSVLLLDCPFAFFDRYRRDEALEKLRRTVKEKNLCVVFAANDYEEAFAVCDKVGILHAGEISQIGTPRELYENPVNVHVARALGRGNYIKARRVGFDNQPSQEFQTIDGEHRLQIGKIEKALPGAITDSVTLAIRPEHISISFGASFPEDNLLKAKIVQVQYQGATTRVKLSADNLMLEALVLRLVGLNIGDECLVGLPPDRISVLKD